MIFRRTMFVLLGVFVLVNCGCQALHPFAQKTHQKIVSARQWASGGVEAFHNGRLSQAKNLFSRAAQQNPDDFSVRENLAKTLFQSGDTQQALSEMENAVELSSHSPRLVVELGEMYLQAGQWLPARRQADLAIELDHRYAAGWALRGKTEKAKSNYDKALSDFQRALGYSPNQQEVEMLVVETYHQMGQPLKALAAVEQILGKHPTHEQPESAVLAKGIALMKLQQLEPAIEILQIASEKQDASSDVFVCLGQAQLLAGQSSQARLTLNRGKLAHPTITDFDRLVNELQTSSTRVASLNLAQ